MRKENKKISYKRIYIKTLAMFLFFYLVVMSLFTGMQSQNNRVNFSNACDQLLERIERGLIETTQNVENIYEELFKQYDTFVTPEEWRAMQQGDLVQQINNYVQGFYSGAYAKVGIYDDEQKEWIAKSGNYLYSRENISLGIDQDAKGKGGIENFTISNYIHLEEYLDLEQIIYLRQLYMDKSNEYTYFCKIKGYRKGNEIIPELIEVYKKYYQGEGSGQKASEDELIQTYKFEVNPGQGLPAYEYEASMFSFEDLYDTDFVFDGSPWQFNEQTHKYFEACSKAFEMPYLAETTKQSSNHMASSITKEVRDVVTREGNNLISLYAIYFPWWTAMKQLLYVYLFSFIMVLLLVSILSRQLWKIYQKQEAMEKGRRLLVDGISHELKTPLSLIRTYSEGIQENISEEKKDDYLAVIIEETYKMDEMVLEMLDLSKLETEAYTLKQQTVNLNQLIEQEKNAKQVLVNQSEIQIIFEVDGEYIIQADKQRIRQVINNLLMNAILHTPQKGKIIISLKHNKLAIENEGEPIPQNQKEHIWEAFYKGNTAIMDYQKGTGLGLAIVSEILRLYHFKYGVENTSSGVRFWIMIV